MPTTANDVLSDWDGSSGVDVFMPRGFVRNPAAFIGRDFKAKLHVYYKDIQEDSVENEVSCRAAQ